MYFLWCIRFPKMTCSFFFSLYGDRKVRGKGGDRKSLGEELDFLHSFWREVDEGIEYEAGLDPTCCGFWL